MHFAAILPYSLYQKIWAYYCLWCHTLYNTYMYVGGMLLLRRECDFDMYMYVEFGLSTRLNLILLFQYP